MASFSCEYDRRSFVDASVGATGTAAAKGAGGGNGPSQGSSVGATGTAAAKGAGGGNGPSQGSTVGATGTAAAKGAGVGNGPSQGPPSVLRFPRRGYGHCICQRGRGWIHALRFRSDQFYASLKRKGGETAVAAYPEFFKRIALAFAKHVSSHVIEAQAWRLRQ